MKIIELNADNVSDYKSIIGPDIAENIGREFYRGIVAEDDGDSPSGALVWEYKNLEDDADTGAEIEFIHSESEEAFKELLAEFDDRSSDENVVSAFFEVDSLSDDEEKNFSEDGFDLTKKESRDLIVTVSDLASLAARKKKTSEKIVSLDDLMEIQFMQGVTNCLFHGKKGIVEDLEYIEKNWFDEKTSSAVITDGKVSGLLLVHRFPSGALMPVLFTAIGPEAKTDLLDLMIFSAKRAVEDYAGDTRVIIRRHNESVTALSQTLFKGKTGGQSVRGERS